MTHATRRGFLAGGLALAGTSAVPGLAATVPGVTFWPDAYVPIELLSVTLHSQSQTIMAAIHELNLKTNVHVTMVPKGLITGPRVRFIDNGQGNWTDLGMPSGNGVREVYINKNVRSLHELGHVLGLIHEHKRSDRDQFIEFTSDFETGLTDGNYALEPNSENHGLPYNIGSFMHYWDTAGNSDNKRTMIYKPRRSLRFGTPEWLNAGAVQAINAIYTARSSQKPTFQVMTGSNVGTLYNWHKAVYLDAGPNHARGWKSGEERSNPFLRWKTVSVGGGKYALYNPHRKRYLDAGPNHTRDASYKDHRSNPYLHWTPIRKYNYYLLYNAHTNAYLDAGPGHMRKNYTSEDHSNPYLRWNFIPR